MLICSYVLCDKTDVNDVDVKISNSKGLQTKAALVITIQSHGWFNQDNYRILR